MRGLLCRWWQAQIQGALSTMYERIGRDIEQ